MKRKTFKDPRVAAVFDRYAVYFKCTSKHVPVFKKLYGDTFTYAGDRAILFTMTDTVPELQLKKCIAAALRYHKVKHLPHPGMQ